MINLAYRRLVIFFFKQKTAYEIRISDWSSDVCSSDLRPRQGTPGADGRPRLLAHPRGARRAHDQAHLQARLPHRAAPEGPQPRPAGRQGTGRQPAQHGDRAGAVQRLRRQRRGRLGTLRPGEGRGADGKHNTETRRVGKGWVKTGKTRWWPTP